jgi:hypothetical protein
MGDLTKLPTGRKEKKRRRPRKRLPEITTPAGAGVE